MGSYVKMAEDIKELKLKLIDSFDHMKQLYLLTLVGIMNDHLLPPQTMDKLRVMITQKHLELKIELNKIL